VLADAESHYPPTLLNGRHSQSIHKLKAEPFSLVMQLAALKIFYESGVVNDAIIILDFTD